MSKRLEDFIRNNRDEFDELEPRIELWGKIVSKLQEQEKVIELPKRKEVKTFSLGFVLRVAATVIVIMGISFVFYIKMQPAGTTPTKVDIAKINPEFAKQQVKYASIVQTGRSELKTLTKSNPELYKEFSAELAKMDSTYKKLNKELVTSPNQERVLRAMIRNLQLQAEVIDQQLNVIEGIKEFKEHQNEIKSI
ncbi:hypothetical protein [Mucilaginibacter myungsuensis]|uniref:Anti-sigma factor n=1 Tax=Mucilaginibacter myungsuensis TaxID=649104 RepID=A0A929KYR5_9SPHI|nr:hypothetical protein [Mucilaginibacter myungsuensis]MBE9661065.1 hypothetical protein [Mucilaginibacter myungsuensis]MDN3597209.1 hypothetical protein [Mucilaginibacter myungsuensis]